MLDATLARDADRAVSLLAEHYEHTMRIMIRVSDALDAATSGGERTAGAPTR